MPLTDADRREIVELVARYSWALDIDRDAAAVADTFQEDGVFVSARGRREGTVKLCSLGGSGNHEQEKVLAGILKVPGD